MQNTEFIKKLYFVDAESQIDMVDLAKEFLYSLDYATLANIIYKLCSESTMTDQLEYKSRNVAEAINNYEDSEEFIINYIDSNITEVDRVVILYENFTSGEGEKLIELKNLLFEISNELNEKLATQI